MKKKKIPREYRETPAARKERVTSGAQYRPTVFRDKKKYSRKDKHKKSAPDEKISQRENFLIAIFFI